ncbi:complex I NDUFA9 subunit family protein [Algiphilus aromaticivorans]|uniref:complex I NDUFA9 subunit family protein n=1 Tax=Algiphilus aromaticivorans TaxID=382454 RepID=UPI0005C165F3|nr:complex I NDUFA9 subunit family protein [Algiphilus aromaticivorans]
MVASTVTVFGGTGFLGRRIVSTLLEAGHAVRVATRNPERGNPAWADRVEPITADVRDPAAVARAVEGADAVVNAVALYVEAPGLDFESVHVEGARNVAEAAQVQDERKLIHISGIGASESSPSAYVRARARGEHAVREACGNAVILQPGVLFGPNDSFVSTLTAVTRLPLVPLFGWGETRLHPVHVDDVASAVRRAIEYPATAGRTFELGGAGTYRYREILVQVLAATGRRRLLVPVPFAVWHLLAAMAACLPSPPLTRDQVLLMRQDNVVGLGAAGFAELGITPRDFAATLSECLR